MARIFDFTSRASKSDSARVSWETRYEGILEVAAINGVPVAGISGPWPDGHYALTWWSSHDSDVAPTLEFYSTMNAARNRVEQVTSHRSKAAA